MKLKVEHLFDQYQASLELKETKALEGKGRQIKGAHVQRPGLSLAGYGNQRKGNRVLIFGKMELSYLKDLSPKVGVERLRGVVTKSTPLVLVSRGLVPPKELLELCLERKVPLYRSTLPTMTLLSKLTVIFSDVFAPTESVHGTLVEAHGLGC